NLTFTPTAAGSRTASVSVNDNAAGSPQTIALSGTGTAPGVSFTPTSLTFASQQVSTTSAAQGVTLTNSGSTVLTISSIGITGTNSGDFAQTNTCPISPNTLAASGTCTINLTFTPTAAWSRTASVSVNDNAAGSPQTVALSGTGTAPGVSFTPTSLMSYSKLVRSTSAAQGVTLTNSGST